MSYHLDSLRPFSLTLLPPMEKHCCKVCGRSFQSGRSLGGHMRSHVLLCSSLDREERLAKGYGLRENPKKTWRFYDVLVEMEKDMVSSWNKACYEEQDNSRSTGVDEEDEEMGTQTGCEVSVKRGRRQRRRSRRAPLPSSPEYSTKEQEDGALCLMMLSRDTGSVTDSSDKKNLNTAVVDSQLVNPSKRSRYECTTCSKSFHSYRALGGHCSSHKKFKGDSTSANSHSTEEIMFRTHECPICGKVFASGQALGGHKRSHFISGTGPVTEVIQIEHKDSELGSLDLNLPAPESCRLIAFLN